MLAVCRRIGVLVVASALLAGCAETYRATGLRPEGYRGDVSRGNGKVKEKDGEKRENRGRRGNNGRGNGRGRGE